MFGLDPEKIMSGLMKSMGVSVEDFAGFINTVMTEMRELRADRLAFKPASVRAYQDICARLDRMETKLDRIITVLDLHVPLEAGGAPDVNQSNGEIHVRSSDLGHG